MGCDKTVLYVWRDQFADSLDLAEYNISCYHITDEYSFSEMEAPLRKREFDLISRVDQIFIHSPALLEKKGGINPNTLYVPNGVDYPTFSAPYPEPADLAVIPHPRVGYVGRIKMQLDWDVLTALVSSHPEYSFVFVGPIVNMGDKTDRMKSLFGKTNVHYLGNRPVADMAAYMQYMDVCLLCYRLNDYTKYIFPLKINEYLAAGTPVVGSNIRSLREFSSVVRIVQAPDEWSSAIAESLTLEARSRISIENRRRVARESDWNTLVRRIAESLCGHLGEEYSARLSTVTRYGEQ